MCAATQYTPLSLPRSSYCHLPPSPFLPSLPLLPPLSPSLSFLPSLPPSPPLPPPPLRPSLSPLPPLPPLPPPSPSLPLQFVYVSVLGRKPRNEFSIVIWDMIFQQDEYTITILDGGDTTGQEIINLANEIGMTNARSASESL